VDRIRRFEQLSQLIRILIRGLGIVILILILADSPLEVAWPAAAGFPYSTLFFRGGAVISIACIILGCGGQAFSFQRWFITICRAAFSPISPDYLNLLQIAEFALIDSLVTLFMFGRADTLDPAVEIMANRLRPWLSGLSPSDGDRLRKTASRLAFISANISGPGS
jgi:hypothetical protein